MITKVSNRKENTRPIAELVAYVKQWEPGPDKSVWEQVFFRVYLKTRCSDAGLKVVDDWARSGDYYPGFEVVQSLWSRFQRDLPYDSTTDDFTIRDDGTS
jgi:hypothetical protein